MDQIAPAREGGNVDKPQRDQRFNAYRYASTANSRKIIDEAVQQVLTYEEYAGLRKNKRRPSDHKTLEVTVDALLADLIHHHLSEDGGGLYVTRSNKVLGTKSRYRPRAYGQQFPGILDALAKPELGWVEQEIAPAMQGRSRSTVVRAGPRLLDRMDEYEVGFADLDVHPHGETIVLKREKDRKDFWDEGGYQHYDDTPETDLYRSELEAINEWLAEADLQYNPSGWGDRTVNAQNRRLRRVFTQGRFDSGGRLFGGFWQSLNNELRCRGVTIKGEPAVELDYGQAGLRILYGLAGLEPPDNDLYKVPGYFLQRKGIKSIMSAMTFAVAPLQRLPQGTRNLFRKHDKIADIIAAIERTHPDLKQFFHRGLGHDCQFVESQILVEVLLALRNHGVVALPIHDAVMVPRSKAELATDVMLRAFRKHAGVTGTVSMSVWTVGGIVPTSL